MIVEHEKPGERGKSEDAFDKNNNMLSHEFI